MPFHADPDPAVGKSQTLRLVDVLLLGPAMIYGGWRVARGKSLPPWFGWLALWSGLGVIAYNGRNYVRLQASRRHLLP